jgi:glycosyltransferase involved in cell wall biosynthesis
MSRILVVSNDHVGSSMAGPGIRAYRFAAELARENDVTLSVPFATDLEPRGFELVVMRPHDEAGLIRLAEGFDAVVSQQLPVRTMHHLARTGKRTVYDLYAPVVVEQLARDLRRDRSPRRELWFRHNALVQEVLLRTGDAFICASERQRDYWLGSLGSLGRLDQAAYREDPSLRNLIDVVPFGVEPAPPAADGPAIKGVVPGIGRDDRVLLWAGGIWDWFDPLTVIRAVARIAERRDDLRLYFLGLVHPNPDAGEMLMSQRAVRLAEEIGVRDRVVFFNFGWIPYAERGRYLLDADLGVSAHFDDLETRLAFRTRLLDCFWAGLPVVTTRGDSLGELVAERDLGRLVDFEDVDGWVEALESLLDDADARGRMRDNALAVCDELVWPRVVEPLARLVAPPARRTPRSPELTFALARYVGVRGRHALHNRGVVGTIRRAFEHLGRAARRRLG